MCVCTHGKREKERETERRCFSSKQLYRKNSSSNDILCAALIMSNNCYKLTTTPDGFQLLSHLPFKWNNQLKQIGGNFDNKHSSVLHAKINGGRGHLHIAYFRQTMFDLWRSWVVSMSQGRTLPLWDHSAPHLIFMSTERTTKTREREMCIWIYFQILIRFLRPLPAVLKDQQWVKTAMEQPWCLTGKSIILL